MPETDRERLAKLETQMVAVLNMDGRITRLERLVIFAAGVAIPGGFGGALSIIQAINGGS